MPEPRRLNGRILVVDDEPFLRTVTTRVIARAGYEVCTADSGVTALDAFHAGGFDAVVSDYQMPGMTGMELLQAIRVACARLPFILLSGTVLPGGAPWGADSACFRSLEKPPDIHVLRRTLVELITESRRSREW